MDRRSQQNHIRAARDWLGRAEDSLARENDVQGDLKLMLAKAELAHVGHCPQSRRLLLWGRRAAALLAAALLVAAFWQPPVSTLPPAVPAVTDNHMTAANSPQTVGMENPPVEEKPEVPQAAPAAERQEYTAPPPPAVSAAEPDQVAEPANNQPAPAPAIQPRLPDAAKQQLMQSAGKILRQ